jgi:hypothetical protein
MKDYSSIKYMSKESWYGLNGVGGWELKKNSYYNNLKYFSR